MLLYIQSFGSQGLLMALKFWLISFSCSISSLFCVLLCKLLTQLCFFSLQRSGVHLLVRSFGIWVHYKCISVYGKQMGLFRLQRILYCTGVHKGTHCLRIPVAFTVLYSMVHFIYKFLTAAVMQRKVHEFGKVASCSKTVGFSNQKL